MGGCCRVCIYSQDSLGLGHLRRNILIGGALLGAKKDTTVLLFADSPVAPFFRLPDRMDHVKLPSIRKVSAGCWEATRLRIDEGELIRLRADLLCNTLLNFRPDLVLIDHMPGGAQGELVPALKALKQAHPACSVVLGLREIHRARRMSLLESLERRSEEHTSELQSQSNLVCRLLLEKKKKNKIDT